MEQELTLQDKALILFKRGLIMQHDFNNEERINSRWNIHLNVRQLVKEEVFARRHSPLD